MKKGLISWARDDAWGNVELAQRPDGLWRYECHSCRQGNITGRVVLLEAPVGLEIRDAADLDSLYNGFCTKAEYFIHEWREVRCLKQGIKVQ